MDQLIVKKLNEITEEEYEQIFAEFELKAMDSFEFGWFTDITMDEIKGSCRKIIGGEK